MDVASSLPDRKGDQWMQTSFPPFSWAVLARGSARRRLSVITSPRPRTRHLRVAQRTHHSLGLWPLSGPVLILPSDRRTPPESHLSPPRLTFPPTRRFQHPPPPPPLPGPPSLPVPDPAAGYHLYNVSLLSLDTWDRT